MSVFDYLIVGSGLFGAIFAYKAQQAGKKCLVIDKRPHLGGNIYCENVEGINVHKYGAHIFHTSNKKVWDFVNNITPFNRFINSPLANYRGCLYNLPFNMNTFYKLWGVKTPEEAKQMINLQRKIAGISNPKNLEEQAISLVGKEIYEILIKGYTEKQWGRKCTELPAFIIKRLPVRFTFDNNYFNDDYQGIPIGGYNKIIDILLENTETKIETDFFADRKYWEQCANNIVFTGKIDEYFNYQFGKLEYRTVKFETITIDCDNYQGNAVVNYTDLNVPYTRIIEHKHFEFGNQSKTVISREFPSEWMEGAESFYPLNDEKNNSLYTKYREMADNHNSVIFGGRLGDYQYYDMHQVIEKAFAKAEEQGFDIL
ncbi:UDP-galactopyranose mutase [Breznakiella homolactica]|uniref:UDP-galactopyranose mutase n=1 Tax=Breznakiella homolactica TaxID=2798577 RepID=A0A7T8B9P4_9SPIR|nr:UDP-galactopyranose mutase [Breznakiella homolactica]QQO09829.1 UDP-galactopyranose mutase [Breznakiella homolactica]